MTHPLRSIEDLPLNRFHRLLTLRSAGGSFVDGYVLSLIGIALMPISNALSLDSFWEGMIAASALIGIFFGGLLGGWLTHVFGRRRMYFVGPVLFVLASLGQYWVQDAATLFLLRLVIGVAVGIEYPVATSMMVEFMPRKYRGPRLAAFVIIWFAGAALAYGLGELLLRLGGPDAWRLVLASAALFGALLLLVRLGTPESPRWLLSKGRHAEAEQIIKAVYGNDYSLKDLPEEPRTSTLSAWSLVRAGYGRRMLFVALFWSCSVIPLFAVYAFAPKVMDALNLKGDMASLGSLVITLLFVIGCALAAHLINALGRRNLLLASFLFSGLALLGLGAFHDSNTALILLLFGLYAVAIGGAQVLALVYPNEIFPTEIRTQAVGLGTSLSRIGAALGTYLVPISLQDYGIAPTLYAAAAITLLGLLVSWAMAPETRSMNLQQAAALP
ncbi:arabinose efflux permease family protein [Pseudomonas sp. GM84]|uniref:MFS transporter n=1 Tax=Pseudomonas sp. GM84 TaxID=1144340 RepID=UPI00026FA509|nr:MFS transporter [Pseudomonas sp. GM84]EJN38188.1 arabinose efflux permease family protein [Pseudomonas sp. GM84]